METSSIIDVLFEKSSINHVLFFKVKLVNGECAPIGSLDLWQLLNISSDEGLRLIFHFIFPHSYCIPVQFLNYSPFFCFLLYGGVCRLVSSLQSLCHDSNHAQSTIRKYSLTELGVQVKTLVVVVFHVCSL